MPVIEFENLDPAQEAILQSFVQEGVLRGYEEILKALRYELALSDGEDPYYGYYIKHVIDLVDEKYQSLAAKVK